MPDLRGNNRLNETMPTRAADLEEPAHNTSVEFQYRAAKNERRRRGACSCGWFGRWRSGRESAWNAMADADEHYNDEAAVDGEVAP